MYEHKILCFLEYEEDDDEEDDEEKWKNGYFIQKIVKKLQPRPTEEWGNFCRHLRWNNDKDTVCLYSNNKIILFCTHIVGYFIY